jgi:5-phospho-D-xylono-1,4-lactonase
MSMRDQSFDFGLERGERFEPEEIETPIDTGQPHVMTALGPIDPSALGLTLHHEHVIARPRHGGDDDLHLDDPACSLAELEDAFYLGLRTIVDMSTADYGRDITDIRWVAQRSPVHIVIATGHHKELYAGPYVGNASVDEIAATMISELRDGIAGSDIRAGVVKAGTSFNAIGDVEERVLRAAAISHLETGASISTHTERGTMALDQISLLQELGVDPGRVILGHLDFQLDLDYLTPILETGAWVSFDQISKEKYAPDTERAAMIMQLTDRGYLGQLLISGDLARKSYLLSYGGSPGLRYLIEQFPLMLMEAGLSASQVRTLLINPARVLTISL